MTFGKGNRTFCQNQIKSVCALKALTHQGKNPVSAENLSLHLCGALASGAGGEAKDTATKAEHSGRYRAFASSEYHK